MGPGGSATYKLSDDEINDINEILASILKTLARSMNDSVKYHVLKRHYLLSKLTKNETPLLLRGKINIPFRGHAGWGEKEGGSVKSWKKRWMVLTPERQMKYYETTDDLKYGKLKGQFNIYGYTIYEDPTSAQVVRNKQIAEAIGWTDQSTIPPPTRYPPMTIELFSDNDRTWHFAPLTLTDKTEWITALKNAVKPVRSYDMDWVLLASYHMGMQEALVEREMRSKIPISQEDPRVTVHKLASYLIDTELFAAKYKALKGDFNERAAMYNAIRMEFNNFLRYQVKVNVQDLFTSIEERRKEADRQVLPNLRQTVELLDQVKDTVKQDFAAPIRKFIASHVVAHVESIFNVIEPIVKNTFVEADKMFKHLCDELMSFLQKSKPAEKLKDSSDIIDRLILQHSDWSQLAPLEQCCEEVTLRLDNIRKAGPTAKGQEAAAAAGVSIVPLSFAHLNNEEISATLAHTLSIFYLRGAMTLKSEIDLELISNPELGHPDKIRGLCGSKVEIVSERFKFDAVCLTQRLIVRLMHSILDLPFIRAVMPSLRPAKAKIQEMTPPLLEQIFNPTLILADALTELVEQAIFSTIGSKMVKIPPRPDLYRISSSSKTSEEDWMEVNHIPFF